MNQLATTPYPEPQPHAVLVVYTRHYNLASTGPSYHYSPRCYHADEELWKALGEAAFILALMLVLKYAFFLLFQPV